MGSLIIGLMVRNGDYTALIIIGIAAAVVNALAGKKGVELRGGDASGHREFKEKEYERLAAILRENLDMDRIYSMLREAAF